MQFCTIGFQFNFMFVAVCIKYNIEVFTGYGKNFTFHFPACNNGWVTQHDEQISEIYDRKLVWEYAVCNINLLVCLICSSSLLLTNL